MGEPSSKSAGRSFAEHLAGAPISWGVCEVPGWGPMLPPDRVLSEMAELGLRGTELGAEGFLPRDSAGLGRQLDRYGLELVGGFLALVLHEEHCDGALAVAGEAAQLMAEAGARMLVVAVVQDDDWSPPRALDELGWRRVAENLQAVKTLASESGISTALHPHVGTLIETAEQIDRALALLDVDWCLDTGHLLIGGVDPVEFARDHGDRVVHVHLKDVNVRVAAELRAGRCSLMGATKQGLFVPLGTGDAPITDVLDALDGHGYDGWLVLEQDTALTADESALGSGVRRDVQTSIAFVNDSAQRNEVHQ